MSQADSNEAVLVPKLPLGNQESEALASQNGKQELPAPNPQAGAWELAKIQEQSAKYGVDVGLSGCAKQHTMIEIPSEWVRTSINVVCELNPKIKLDDDLNVGFMPMSAVPKEFHGKPEYEIKKWHEVKKGYTQFKDGDALFAKITPCFENGKACVIEQFPNGWGAGSTEFHVLRPISQCIHPKLLLALVKTREFLVTGAVNMTGSVGHKRVPKEFVENYPLPFPPFAEQQQIADQLDELLAQVDTLKTRLDTIPKILKRFRQSVLAAAVSGKLTEDWREENKPPCTDTKNITEKLFDNGITAGNFGKKSDRAPAIQEDEIRLVRQNECNWPMVRIGAICGCIVPNRDKPKTFSGGYHWLLTPHFEDQSIRIDYTKIENGLSEDEVAEYRAKVIAENSVVMTCVGRVGLSAVLSQKAVINQQLHAFIPNEYILADFLAYMIRANVKYYEDKATSTTVSYLNKTACNSLPIPLPSIEEQTEIVNRVEQLLTYADQIEQRVKDAQARVNHLTQSILAKAFRGELTADWREQNPDLISGENSAEALLARIKAERESIATTKKIGRKVKV